MAEDADPKMTSKKHSAAGMSAADARRITKS
jgi:hypothetical protein